MGAPTLEAQEEKLLTRVSHYGGTAGNITLMRDLGWTEDTYWSVRNRLLDRGALELGKGKGGSVRIIKPEVPPSNGASPSPTPIEIIKEELRSEAALWSPMAKVIQDSWVSDAGFDHSIVQITAQQGSKATGGKWSRPDIAVASLSTYPYVPGRHFDVVTFEIKTPDGSDITCVYEALAHLRSATRAYVLLHVPAERSKELESTQVDIFAEAKKHGVGVITAERPNDYSTWEEVVDPTRFEPDPRRLNDFLAKQFSKEQLEQIMKWFK